MAWDRKDLEAVDQIGIGDRVECEGCGAHIATFAKPIFRGSPVSEEVFSKADGQGPWKNGEPMNCRKCGHLWFNGYRFLNHVPFGLLN